MNSQIYMLADAALTAMLENPNREYRATDLSEIVGCTENEATNICAILLARKYATFPISTKTKEVVPNSGILLSNEGGDFILYGGFSGLIERDKQARENTLANTAAAIAQKKTTKATLCVAVLTLVVLTVQVWTSIRFGKSEYGSTETNGKIELIENAIDTAGSKFRFAP